MVLFLSCIGACSFAYLMNCFDSYEQFKSRSKRIMHILCSFWEFQKLIVQLQFWSKDLVSHVASCDTMWFFHWYDSSFPNLFDFESNRNKKLISIQVINTWLLFVIVIYFMIEKNIFKFLVLLRQNDEVIFYWYLKTFMRSYQNY